MNQERKGIQRKEMKCQIISTSNFPTRQVAWLSKSRMERDLYEAQWEKTALVGRKSNKHNNYMNYQNTT